MPNLIITSCTITSIFNGFIARSPKILFPKTLRLEIEYLADMFRKNEHDRKMLQKIINIFEKETNRINNNNNNNDKKQTTPLPVYQKRCFKQAFT